jgi:hypothetical protein
MAINITSLFQDILESPEQKQQRQMAEGFARNQNAVSQLTGLATAAAPLVGTMAELQGRRTEALQRGVGGLLGRDVRSTSEKLQDALSRFNPQDPASVSQTTQMLQQMGLGAQGAQLAAMALEEQQRKAAVDLQAEAARQAIDLNVTQEARAVEDQTMARAQEVRAIGESAFRMRAAEQAFNQAATQEERDAAQAIRDEQVKTLSQLNAGLEIAQRVQEQIDQRARESSRESNAASLRNMGTEYEPLAILMETPGSDVVGVMSQAATLSANLLRSSAEDYKTLTKDEQTQALTLVKLLGEENPLDNPWFGSPTVPPAQLYNQIAIARRMNPNAGMESWVATAAAQIKTGLGQVLEDNVDSVLEAMPGMPSSQAAPLNIEAAAADSAASLSNPPVPIPAANVVPTVPAGSAREQMLANANRMEEGMSGRRRQQAVTDTYNVLLATNNSNRAAGKPVKTRQELLSEAQAMVNQQYPQGN